SVPVWPRRLPVSLPLGRLLQLPQRRVPDHCRLNLRPMYKHLVDHAELSGQRPDRRCQPSKGRRLHVVLDGCARSCAVVPQSTCCLLCAAISLASVTAIGILVGVSETFNPEDKGIPPSSQQQRAHSLSSGAA